jgi:cytochrome P450
MRLERGIGAAQLRRLLGNGLVSSNGDFWKAQRRQIQPAFGSSHLRAYSDTMVRHASQWIESWEGGDVLDVSAQMMSLTLKIVAEVLMGQRIESENDDVGRIMLKFRASVGGLSAVIPQWVPYPPRWREQRALGEMEATLLLATLHQRARLHLAQPQAPGHRADITLAPRGGSTSNWFRTS